MNELNDRRNVVAHSSSGISLSIEELSQIQQYEQWLQQQVAGGNSADVTEDVAETET